MLRWIARRYPILLLNWVARYYPILRILDGHIKNGDMLLDIGSGPFGLAAFYHRPFVGCDVAFPWKPRDPMLPVRCSGTRLPFADASFPAVIVSDVLEHIPPQLRPAIIQEALRVSKNLVVFGFPCGPEAQECDRVFREHLKQRGIEPFEWLEEHMLHPFPDEKLFHGLDQEWTVESIGNENIGFRAWANRIELSRAMKGLFWFVLTVAPRLSAALLRLADRPPYYRRIVVASRKLLPKDGVRFDALPERGHSDLQPPRYPDENAGRISQPIGLPRFRRDPGC